MSVLVLAITFAFRGVFACNKKRLYYKRVSANPGHKTGWICVMINLKFGKVILKVPMVRSSFSYICISHSGPFCNRYISSAF